MVVFRSFCFASLSQLKEFRAEEQQGIEQEKFQVSLNVRNILGLVLGGLVMFIIFFLRHETKGITKLSV